MQSPITIVNKNNTDNDDLLKDELSSNDSQISKQVAYTNNNLLKNSIYSISFLWEIFCI
jgi:hypothetical protein